jgi:hypothetical protein
MNDTSFEQTPQPQLRRKRKRQMGIFLLIVAVICGLMWGFTRDPTYEPVGFVLTTLAAILLVG